MKRVLVVLAGLFSFAGLTHGAFADTPCSFQTGALGPVIIQGNVIAGPGCNLSNTTVNGNVTVTPDGSLTVLQGSTTRITGNVNSKDATSIDIRAGWIGGDVKVDGTTGVSGGVLRLGAGIVGGDCNVPIDSGDLWPVVTVEGDVKIRRSVGSVKIESAKIGGDLRLHDNTGNSSNSEFGEIILCQSTVEGRVAVTDNEVSDSFANALVIFENSIARNLNVSDNVVKNGSAMNVLQIFSNTVGGNVQVNHNKAIGSDLATNVIDVSDNTITRHLDCRANTPAPTDDKTGIGNTFRLRRGHVGGQNRKFGGQCDGLWEP